MPSDLRSRTGDDDLRPVEGHEHLRHADSMSEQKGIYRSQLRIVLVSLEEGSSEGVGAIIQVDSVLPVEDSEVRLTAMGETAVARQALVDELHVEALHRVLDVRDRGDVKV